MKRFPFDKAVPVWPAGKETEQNLTVGFGVTLPAHAGLLRIAAGTLYRAYLDGALIAYGPARTPHGFARVDEWRLPAADKPRYLYIEVSAYNVDCFYLANQPPFLCAEVLGDGAVMVATAADGDFKAVIVPNRTQKIVRYSFQRGFMEDWRIDAAYRALYAAMPAETLPLAEPTPLQFLPRGVDYATMTPVAAEALLDAGTVVSDPARAQTPPRMLHRVVENYRSPQFDAHPAEEAHEMVFTSTGATEGALSDPLTIADGHYVTMRFPKEYTGIVDMQVTCTAPTTLYLLFDELLIDGDVDFTRMTCGNVLSFRLQPGTYPLQTAEVYTMQVAKLVAIGGDCTVSVPRLLRYDTPLADVPPCPSHDPRIERIYAAAVNTYAQGSMDIYMDCPSRERAGWLCDSFFTSRTEYALTGGSRVEYNFLQNFVLPERYPNIVEGMFPMCYPSDFTDGTFIPNWAMWLVMQLQEYQAKRNGDPELVAAFEPKVRGLIRYLDGFLNEDGLLENLPSWVFVEWSRANDLVKGVNYPSNMLYAGTLEAAAKLYNDADYQQRADRMREEIRRQSLRGQFFVDQATRGEDGKLCWSGESTEVCQYYAFFFRVATPERDAALWETLLHQFGPQRRQDNPFPEVAFANAFIGNYLRLDLLYRAGRYDELLANIDGYFYNMAVTTGTLWEHDSPHASLNHAFASHVVYWLLGMQKQGYAFA